MAGGSLLALLDDIASVLDDVALLTKAAGKKTAGVLGDDIALNAQQVSGTVAKRELPVVWAVAKGSFVNKLILVPLALAISAFLPRAIIPLLMIGGLYLCYEGFEKIIHSLFHRGESAHLDSGSSNASQGQAGANLANPVSISNPSSQSTPEQTKIKGAIRTDFILSAEIVAITLGTVAAASFGVQAAVVSGVAVIMTAGVYGFVAGIVKLDDAGLYLQGLAGQGGGAALARAIGRSILVVAPYLMKGLSIAGTAAMFLVGGGILLHGIPGAEHWSNGWVQEHVAGPGFLPSMARILSPLLLNALLGIAAGALVFAAMQLIAAFRR